MRNLDLKLPLSSMPRGVKSSTWTTGKTQHNNSNLCKDVPGTTQCYKQYVLLAYAPASVNE